LTQDKDFGDLFFRLRQAHFGVILIRLEDFKPHLEAQIVLNAINAHKDELTLSFTVISTQRNQNKETCQWLIFSSPKCSRNKVGCGLVRIRT